MNAMPPAMITPDAAIPAEGLPIKAIVERLDPAARAAFHHELRRGRSGIEALTFGVVIPDMIESLWRGRR